MAKSTSTPELDYRPSYLAAGIAAGLVFVLYLITLSPETAMWDTSEYIAAAYTLGIPHPPGNPMFVLLGRVFTLLPIAPNIAMRVNILAALSSAVAAGMWFLITERVLVGWFNERWQRVTGGALAALIGSTAFTVWAQSVVNEKVYTVSLCGLAIASWLIVRWCDEPDGPKADKTIVLVAYLIGLGYGIHMAGLLVAPAVGLAILIRRPKTIMRWKLMLACVGALILGGSPFATQPIRSAHFPAVNEGEPTGCRTELHLSCTVSKGTYDAFMYNFNRGQYGKPEITERQAPLGAQVGMWWLYFKWQWFRDAHGRNVGMQGMLASVFLVLGLIGGWVHYRRDPRSFAFFGPLMLTLTFLLIYYLNFKYGASQDPELADSVQREVRDRDYFFLWSFSAWSVWAALGLTYLWESLGAVIGHETQKIGNDMVELPTKRSWILTSPILLLAIVPLFANWQAASRSGQTDTADFAIDMLNSVEPYGVLVTVGDNDTFPLWYAQEVLGVRKDVIVANTSLMNTDWYMRQMIRRPAYDYDAAKGPAAYRGGTWVKPVGPPVKMTFDQADSIPIGTDLTQPQLFVKDHIRAVIPPHFLARADWFVLEMIHDGTRPIYLSRTSGNYANELGITGYMLTQGLARKLMPDSVRAGRDTVAVPGEGMVDVPRTMELWKEFRAPASLIRKNDWVDRPSVGIPYLYVSTGVLLYEAMQEQGKMKEATDVLAEAKKIASATQLQDFFGPETAPAPPPLPSGDSAKKTAVPLKKAAPTTKK
jgi:transmembrane protein TMEM260 (protein O-mannosyltransferase)